MRCCAIERSYREESHRTGDGSQLKLYQDS
jgi:hypothetical protein